MTISARAAEQPTTRRDRDLLPALLVLITLMFGVPSMLVFEPLGSSATPAAMLGTALFGVWISTRLVGGRPPSGPWARPMHLALIFFAVAILLSVWVANLRAPTGAEMRSSDRGVLTLIAWSGVCLGVADGISSRYNLDRFLRAVVLGAAAMAVVGMLQFFVGIDIAKINIFPGLSPRSDLGLIQERSSFRRVTGTTSHPLEFGVVLATVLPLAVHYVVSSRWRRRRDIICLVLIAVAIPMSIGRSATLGSAVAFIVLFAGWNGRQRLRAVLLLPVFLVGLRLLIPGLLGTIKSLFVYASVDPSISGRTDDYAQAEDYFAQAPILGRGWGTFLPEMYPLLDNQYIGQVMETGPGRPGRPPGPVPGRDLLRAWGAPARPRRGDPQPRPGAGGRHRRADGHVCHIRWVRVQHDSYADIRRPGCFGMPVAADSGPRGLHHPQSMVRAGPDARDCEQPAPARRRPDMTSTMTARAPAGGPTWTS